MPDELKNIKYIEIGECSAPSTVRIDDIESFMELVTKLKPSIIYVRKGNFLKYMFNMSNKARSAIRGHPEPLFSTESLGYEFGEKINSDVDFGVQGPITKRIKERVWQLCSSDPEYDSEDGPPGLENPRFDYKVVDNGEELEVYKYLDIDKGGDIEKLTEFIIIHDQVTYILTEYNALSDKIDPSSKRFRLSLEEEEPHSIPKDASQRSDEIESEKNDDLTAFNHREEIQYFGNSSSSHQKQGNPRADTFNPNNPASKATSDNRANQLNPKHSAYHKSRGRK